MEAGVGSLKRDEIRLSDEPRVKGLFFETQGRSSLEPRVEGLPCCPGALS